MIKIISFFHYYICLISQSIAVPSEWSFRSGTHEKWLIILGIPNDCMYASS